MKGASILYDVPELSFYSASFLLIVVAVLVNLEITFSYLGETTNLLRETSRLIAVWIGFLSFPLITVDREHIMVTYFSDRFSLSERWGFEALNELVQIVVVLGIFVSGVFQTMDFSGGTTALADLPVILIYLPTVLGTGIALLYFKRTWVRSVLAGPRPS